jgi:crotonobetainyl-CoA:carnitine CoA-transferase CaiB-like acyl-CoA transferase
LREILSAIFRRKVAAQWEADLVDANVGCVAVADAPVEANYLGALGEDNGYIAHVEHPIFGHHPRLAPLVTFSRSGVVAKPGCVLGQHTNAVLREVGYSDEQIAALRDKHIVRTA